MNPKDVILAALGRKRPERVPVALIGAGAWSAFQYGISLREMAGDAEKMTRMLVDMADRIESDIVYAGSGYPNFPVAALGGKIKYREIGVPDLEAPLASSEEEVEMLDVTRLDSDPVMNTVRETFRRTKAEIGDRYLISLTAWGPFTLGARIVGEELFVKAIYKKPAFVEKVLAFVTDLLIRFFAPVVEDGSLELITIGDPTASGDLISRKHFETYALPHLKRLTDWAKANGTLTLLHICGDTTDRLDLYPLTGATCISLDYKTDFSKAYRMLHGVMCLAGNVDPVQTLLQGTVEDVEAACRKAIETAGKDGGFILMPGCDIPPTIPVENIRRFIDVGREWRL